MVTGNDLRLLRESQNVSLHKFAKQAGKSAGHLSRVERQTDGRYPSPNIVYLYESILGVSVAATVAYGQPTDTASNVDGVDRREMLTKAAVASSVSLTLVASDAKATALFARQITEGSIDDLDIEEIEADCRQLARRYVSEPLETTFVEIRNLRSDVFDLLQRNRIPGQMRSLYLAASRLCGLQAHVCLDLGYYPEADTHARAALKAANAAGHHGAFAWVRSLQSLVAYWDGRPDDAVRFADDGLLRAQDLSTGVRLSALKARAAAVTGNTGLALAALGAAEETRGGSLVDDETGGVFCFPEAKQAAYAGTTLLGLADGRYSARAIAHSTRALDLYEAASRLDRSSGDTLAANLDLAAAYLATDDLDAAASYVSNVVNVAPNRRTASIRKRARGLAVSLATPRYADNQLGSELRANLVAFAKPLPAISSVAHQEST